MATRKAEYAVLEHPTSAKSGGDVKFSIIEKKSGSQALVGLSNDDLWKIVVPDSGDWVMTQVILQSLRGMEEERYLTERERQERWMRGREGE